MFYLLLCNPHVVLDVGEDGWLHEEPFVTQPRTSTLNLRAFLLAALDEIHDFVKLLLVDLQKDIAYQFSRV